MEYCTLCYNYHNSSSFKTLSCGCLVCRDATRLWMLTLMENFHREDFNVICPFGDFNHVMTDSDIRSILSDEDVKNYEKILLKRDLKDLEFIRMCPGQSCNYMGWVDTKRSCGDQLQCGGCGIKWSDPSLKPVSMKVYNFLTKTLKGDSDTFNEVWKEIWTNYCPKCQVPIEKNGGCPHMTCERCKFEFCWFCMQRWSSHDDLKCGFKTSMMYVISIFLLILSIVKVFCNMVTPYVFITTLEYGVLALIYMIFTGGIVGFTINKVSRVVIYRDYRWMWGNGACVGLSCLMVYYMFYTYIGYYVWVMLVSVIILFLGGSSVVGYYYVMIRKEFRKSIHKLALVGYVIMAGLVSWGLSFSI